MTLQELKSGKQFSYRSSHYLSLYKTYDDKYCLTRNDQYYANVSEMNGEVIKLYSYLLDNKVEAEIIISECEDIEDYHKRLDERAKIKEAEEQELQDEYGIGAYPEED